VGSETADLIVRNARLFVGGDPRLTAAFPAWSREGRAPERGPTALALAGERIALVGVEREVEALRGPRTEVIDAAGGLVTPGFEDAHVHLELGARSLAEADLAGTATIEALAARLRAWEAAHPDAQWVVGRGWHYGLFPGGMPDRTLLDRLVPDRPAMLESFDGHTHWLNGAALAAAGITSATPKPRHGTIERDASGEPTGILKEFAHELLDDVIPRPSDAELDGLFLDAFAQARRLGITALQDAWTEPAGLRRIARLRDRGAIGVRVRVAAPADETAWHEGEADGRRRWGEALDAYATELAEIGVDAWLRGGVVKAFADGVVESGTAWMLEPYEGAAAGDEGAFGRPTWPSGAVAAMTSVAVEKAWQVQIHAIGDAAIRAALDAHEQAVRKSGSSETGRVAGGRIEHVEWPDPSDVGRFGRLGVIASLQPTHALPLPYKHAVREARIGARIRRGWPAASLLRSGALLAFGSDWPIATPDPLRQVHAAVTRRDPESAGAGPWLPDECLTLSEALACAAWGSATAGDAGHRRGTLAAGMDADLTVLDRDVLAEGAEALLETRVAATIVGGRVVYRAADR
jgi:predicted amidohydrolase YtcJ